MSSNSFNIGDGKGAVELETLDSSVEIALDGKFFLMAGPCVIESRESCLEQAEIIVTICQKLNVPLIFKASFDKANRSSISSYRGPGLEKGLEILAQVREKLKVPVMTDVHESTQAQKVGQVVDCLQIPAFLCRQTDLLCACAETGRAVNIKKGQFVSPAEMKNAVEKVRTSGNEKIMLTERGTFFGYNSLVNDMTAINQMQQLGCPVIFDATHSTQQPGGLGNATAGRPQMAPILAKAALAAGANGLFIEVHPEPAKAKSDAGCIMPIEWLEDLLVVCKKIFNVTRQ